MPWWLDILKFQQTSLFYSSSYLNSGGLELCFGRAKPIKDPRGYGTVWQSFSLLFDAIDSQKHLGYVICQACKICQNFCYEHDSPQSGLTHSGSVYSASLGKTVLGLFCLQLNTVG